LKRLTGAVLAGLCFGNVFVVAAKQRMFQVLVYEETKRKAVDVYFKTWLHKRAKTKKLMANLRQGFIAFGQT
jgi:hypothetical protein